MLEADGRRGAGAPRAEEKLYGLRLAPGNLRTGERYLVSPMIRRIPIHTRIPRRVSKRHTWQRLTTDMASVVRELRSVAECAASNTNGSILLSGRIGESRPA
jgi:hypothetical protein